jgi:Rrf2 family iron-sulfur cluster assembly transcriptional regulator
MSELTVAEIILAVDEPIDATQCGGKENCKDEGKCLTHDLWATLNARIFDYLGSVTLRQLVENQRAKEAGVAPVHDMRLASARREAPSA